MSQKLNSAIAVIGIDIGKNSFHLTGLDERGAEVVTWPGGSALGQHAAVPDRHRRHKSRSYNNWAT